jgi:hypothetical protein
MNRNKNGQIGKVDLTGKKFGRLIVVSEYGRRHGSVTWFCRCECGKEKVIRSSNLLSGSSTSCGCYAAEQRKKSIMLPDGVAAFNRLVHDYRQGAEKRGLSWELTDEQASGFFKGNCTYCGIQPLQKFKGDWGKSYNGLFYYNGIDRKDNTVGYLPENCVSCCKICNRSKHSLPQEEFEGWIGRVASFNYKLLAKA